MDPGSGPYSYLLEFDLVSVGVHPCLDTDVEIPHLGGIPQIALCFGKSLDQIAKPADGGVGVFCIRGQFQMGAVRSFVASGVEYENLLAQRRYKRLKIRRRVDVQIDIEELSRRWNGSWLFSSRPKQYYRDVVGSAAGAR